MDILFPKSEFGSSRGSWSSDRFGDPHSSTAAGIGRTRLVLPRLPASLPIAVRAGQHPIPPVLGILPCVLGEFVLVERLSIETLLHGQRMVTRRQVGHPHCDKTLAVRTASRPPFAKRGRPGMYDQS